METATTSQRGARISIKPICFSGKVKLLIGVHFAAKRMMMSL
jgi:hypothetical protein